jgi:hypothetical protein
LIAVERNVEEQRELLDETIDKIIIDHEKINTIVSIVSKHEKSLAISNMNKDNAEKEHIVDVKEEEEIIFETKDFEIDGVLYLKFTDPRAGDRTGNRTADDHALIPGGDLSGKASLMGEDPVGSLLLG